MKKMTSLLLAGVLVLGVGCQNQESTQTPTETTESVETTETGESAVGTGEAQGQLVAEVGDRTVTRDYFEKNVALQTYGYETLRDEEGNFDQETQSQINEIRELLLEDIVDLNVVLILAKEAGITVDQAALDEAVQNYMNANLEPDVESPSETALGVRTYFENHGIDEPFIRLILEEQMTFQMYLSHLEQEYFSDEEKIQALEANYVAEVEASHILVDDKELADEIYAKATPENFPELAKEYSNDPGSKEEGGNLGFFKREMMVKEFADQAFNTPVGTISEPVKSDFGYHIIYVTGQKTMKDIRETEEPDVVDMESTNMRKQLLMDEYYRVIEEAKGSIQVNTYPVN